MKNKELIKILMDMDLEKEVILWKDESYSTSIIPSDITEKEKKIIIQTIV